jgi:hypothetical protein
LNWFLAEKIALNHKIGPGKKSLIFIKSAILNSRISLHALLISWFLVGLIPASIDFNQWFHSSPCGEGDL